MAQPPRNFDELLLFLREQGKLYITPFNFNTFVAFLYGFEEATLQHGLPQPLGGFREWLQIREKNEFSATWKSYIFDVLAKKSHKKALKEFFALYSEFSESKEENK